MKKRGVIITTTLAVFLVAVAFIVVRVFSGPPEPGYQGKTLSQWLAVYFPTGSANGVNSAVAEETKNALHQMGTNALPVLVRMLGRHDSAAKRKLIEAVNGQSVIKISMTPEALDQSRAMLGFYAMGAEAAPAVPQLISIYEQHPSMDVRVMAAGILVNLGPAASPAVPALVRGASSSNDSVRAVTIRALGLIRSNPELEVPALTKALADPFQPVRLGAAQGLGAYGSAARSAVPALVQLIQNEPTSAPGIASGFSPANAAAGSLQQIDPETAAKVLTNSVRQWPERRKP